MKKITSIGELRESIIFLEIKRAAEWQMLKEQLHTSYEGMKPLNLIKRKFKEIISSPDLKTNIINAVVGAATGFAAKKVLIGKTNNPLTKLLGVILEMAVANSAVKNADGIKSLGSIIMKKLLTGKSEKV